MFWRSFYEDDIQPEIQVPASPPPPRNKINQDCEAVYYAPKVFELVTAIKCLFIGYVIISILVKENNTPGLAVIHMKFHLKDSFFYFIQEYLSLPCRPVAMQKIVLSEDSTQSPGVGTCIWSWISHKKKI